MKLVLKDSVVEGKSESFFGRRGQLNFLDLLRTLKAARDSRQVRVLVLVVKNPAIGWAQIEEIHAELDRFHTAGKCSLAFLEQADNRTFYLACGAQRIYLPPAGGVELVGLRTEVLFFRNALDYLGIQPELFSLGDYKSAGEIFTRDRMSEASRTMSDSLLGDLQDRLQKKVASARQVHPELVQQWIDEGPYTASQARERGLVDGLAYEDELEALARKLVPGVAEHPPGKLARRDGLFRRIFTFHRPRIAYIVAEGLIIPGESRRGRGGRPLIGAETVAGLLRQARESKRVKAVVLRVDSPGGSALASDLIWREVKLTNSRKPVIVSFGNVAASGGYYVAAAGARILSMPAALTGSIGVIGGKFNIQGLLARFRISTDSVEKGAHAGYHSITRPFSPSEAQVVAGHIREFYEDLFLKKVAEGRRRSLEEIRTLAEGRVWTGRQAVSCGLVDEIGGIERALELAREAAGLRRRQKPRLVRLARRRRWLDLLPLPFFQARESSVSPGPLFLMTDRLDIR